MSTLFPDDQIQSRLLLVRGHLVLLQSDLARLYGVTASRLLSHAQRFPGEFCFPLEPSEIVGLIDEREDRPQQLHVFSEHGALLAAYLINTPESVAMGLEVTRAFIRFRQQSLHPHALAFAGC